MKEEKKNNIIVVHVSEIICQLLKKIWLMLLVGVIFAGAGFYIGGMNKQVPMYTSYVKLYVTGMHEEALSGAGLSLGQQIMKSYIEIMNSKPVLETVSGNLNLKLSAEEVRGKVSQYVPEGTCMLEVGVSDLEPEQSKKIADELVKVAADRAKEIMNCTPPTVYEEASIPTAPSNVISNTNSIMYAGMGGVAGIGIVVFIVLIMYFANSKVDTPHKLTDKLHLETLGIIPNGKGKNADYQEKAYQSLYARLQYEKSDAKVFQFVSTTKDEDKYECIAKLAEDIKTVGKKVVLLDTNVTNPEWGGTKDGQEGKGLEEYLKGEAELKDVLVEKEEIGYIFANEGVLNGPELLSGNRYTQLIGDLKKEYDVILVNTAPLSYVRDALCELKYADAIITVFSAKKSKVRPSKEMLELLQEKDFRVDGAILKDVDVKKGGKYFRTEFGKYYGVYGK